ncbi:MAG: sensor histidine kinase [Acidobacteriaceae bacterium]|nr:sensor histidine kinase [Acidobacteriaceae bacterium]
MTLSLWVAVVALPAKAADMPSAGHAKLQSIWSAIEQTRAASQAVPVMIRGIVILNHHSVVIQDRTGATEISVDLSDANRIALGDEVEVTGEMVLAPRPQVRNASLRRLWGGAMPLPLAITSDQAAEGESELALVQMDAQLVSVTSAGLTGVRLNLSSEHQSFSAVMPDNDLDAEIPVDLIQPGATLRITGVLFISHDPGASHSEAFTLQLRGPDDLQLLKGPSWWTGPHILLLAGIFLIMILILVNIYLRQEHRRYRTIAEERAKIARDIHDTLAQGFAGISLELEAADQVMEHSPEQAKKLLKEALHLVRHSRNESHLSIEMLRAPSRSDRLDVLLAHSIQQMKAATATEIEQQVSGEPVALSYNIVNNLFRIGQEAITNAVRHASATRIRVGLRYEPRGVTLEVEDNGKGFDPDRAPGTAEGHFGLIGIRERVAAIDAELQIQSAPGRTLICVRVPL